MPEPLIQEARDAWNAAVDADAENRREMLEDLRYCAGDLFTPDEVEARRRQMRPALRFNFFPQYVRQVVNDMRLSPPSINVRPVDNGADPKVAKVYTGLIRNIESQSNSKAAYITAAENAARVGQGFFRVTYDYTTEDSFEMELGIGRMASPFAAVIDPAAVEPTACDANFLFVPELVPLADFRRRFPKASIADWESPEWGDWREGEFVRIAEWWRKVPVTRTLALLRNGAIVDLDELDEDAPRVIEAAGGVVRERKAQSHRVEMRLLSGVEELDEPHEWPGRFLPVVRVCGEEINVGERVIRHGVVRFARDPAKLYTIQRNALAEAAQMAPKVKWLGTHAMFAANKKQWANANQLNLPYLAYTPDPSMPNGRPERIAPDMPAASLLQDAQLALSDMENTIGLHRENIGKASNAQSGRAILARQREGDVSTYHYTDNLADSVAQCGRILIDIIPRIYDTARQVRVLGPDGKTEFAPINVQTPEGRVVNDLSAGRYDVVASVGPSFSTQREEARESMMAFFSAYPQAGAVAGDLFAESMDWPGAEEFAKRLRKQAVAMGLAEPREGEQAPGPPPPDPNMLLAQAEMAKAEASKMKAASDAQVKAAELEVEKARLLLEAERVGLERQKLAIMTAEAESKINERDTGTRIDAVQATQAIVRDAMRGMEARMAARQPAGPPAPAVGIQLGPDMERAMAASMERSAEQMQVIAGATQQMAASVVESNQQTAAALEQLVAVAAAPRRAVRGPNGAITGVEIVR